jgi:hypothetical protein
MRYFHLSGCFCEFSECVAAPCLACRRIATAELSQTGDVPCLRERAQRQLTVKSVSPLTTADDNTSGKSACRSRRLGRASAACPGRWLTEKALRWTERVSRPTSTPPPPRQPPSPPALHHASGELPRRLQHRGGPVAAGRMPQARARGAVRCAWQRRDSGVSCLGRGGRAGSVTATVQVDVLAAGRRKAVARPRAASSAGAGTTAPPRDGGVRSG